MFSRNKESTPPPNDAGDASTPSDLPEGGTVSINHPNGLGPSDVCIFMVLTRPDATWRIVRMNEFLDVELLVMKAKMTVSKREAASLANEYREKALSRGDTHSARRLALASTLANNSRLFSARSRVSPEENSPTKHPLDIESDDGLYGISEEELAVYQNSPDIIAIEARYERLADGTATEEEIEADELAFKGYSQMPDPHGSEKHWLD